jgi:tRNA threonylcarbamoyladenosine biosynthesis protein TsaE
MGEIKFLSNSPAATTHFGKKLGEKLSAGAVLALIGELGCGKTLLTRGVCDGLDVPLRQVNSPTFVLVNEYRGRLPVFHMDLYRLTNADEGFEIGIMDYLERGKEGIILIEWAEKILSILPDDYIKIEFEITAARKRQISITTNNDKFSALFKELCSA